MYGASVRVGRQGGTSALVFAADLDRNRHPLRTRFWGVLVGSILLGCVAAALVSPRTAAFMLPVLTASLLASTLARKDFEALALRMDGLGGAAAALVAFALLSTLWSASPFSTVSAPLTGASYVALGIFTVLLMRREPQPNMYHLAEGLWMGMAAGLIYLLFEIVSHQAIKISLYNTLEVPVSALRPAENFKWNGEKLVAISPKDLTRSITPITLMMWPALFALKATGPAPVWRVASVAFFALSCAVVALSGHEASKVALAASILIFMLACLTPHAARRLLQFGVVAACVGVIPVSLALHRLDLHRAAWVQPSLQHRVVIWNHTAEEALKQPLIGIGAGMMYELQWESEFPGRPELGPVKVPHAHNVFLQTWYELGAIGVVLLGLFGLAAIEAVRRLGSHGASYGYATIAAAATLLAASYGMWQAWFLSLFGLSAASFILAVRVSSPHEALAAD